MIERTLDRLEPAADGTEGSSVEFRPEQFVRNNRCGIRRRLNRRGFQLTGTRAGACTEGAQRP